MRALLWWIDRWRKSSAFMDMTLEQQAAYRNLLDEATLRGGPLPKDERVLAKACGDALAWERVRPVVMGRFTLREDGWHHDTLDVVLAKQAERAASGRKGGLATHAKVVAQRLANVVANPLAKPPAKLQATARAKRVDPDPDPDPKKKREKERADARSLSPAAPSDPLTDDAVTRRAGDFVRRYRALYPEYRQGARYLGHEHRDYLAAVSLCQTWPDDRLEKLAICFLTTNHQFAQEGSRTLPQLRALASWLDGELAKWEHEHAG